MPKPLKLTNIKFGEKPKKDIELKPIIDPDETISEARDIIKEAKELYADIIEEANAEAMKIIGNAKEEIETIKKEAYENSYREGLNKGLNEGKVKAESIIAQAKEVKKILEDRKDKVIKEAEEELIHIVLEISKKIIGQELQQNNEAIVSLIKLALERCAFKNKISIKVSSEDYIYVLENKELIESLVEGVSEIDIIEDKFLSKGDCIIDTPAGQVNSSAELQIKELEQAFLFVLRNE